MTPRTLLAPLAAALLLASPAFADGPAPDEAPEQIAPEAGADHDLVGTAWRLVELDGAPAESVETSLVFNDGGGVGGNGGCNSYGGNISIEGDTVDITEVFSTMMACPEPAMSQEQGFFAALEATTRLDHAEGELSLLDADDAVLARLVEQ